MQQVRRGARGALRISVVLPFRDAEATLAEALDGVLADLEAGDEVIAVDDGSTDASARVADRIAARDGRLRIAQVEGSGLVAALRTGVAAARGELVARMDADDVSLPGRFAAQRALLASDARLGAVGTLVAGFPEAALGEGLRAYIAWQNALVTPEEHARDLFVEAPLCHPSVTMRRELAVYRDVPWPEDYDLWLRLDADGWRMAKVPAVLLRWRHHEGRATFRGAAYTLERHREAKAHHLAPRLRARGRPVWVWGAGPTGRRFARALEAEGVRAAAFVDIDPRKTGRTARGAPIEPPAALVRGACHVVVAVGTRGARDVVRGQLASRGFAEGADFTCVA